MSATLTTPSVPPSAPAGASALRRRLGRYRLQVAGLCALLLAGGGEQLLRGERGHPGPATGLGMLLVAVAVGLVGVVAWRGIRGRAVPADAAHQEAPAAARPRTRVGQALSRWPAVHARLGTRGTLAGLALVGALADGCYALLQPDFRNPLAPWLWAAMLLALAATFAGVAPAPTGPSLVPHDPA